MALGALRLPPGIVLGTEARPSHKTLPWGGPLAEALPDGGLPRGAVTELSAPSGLGQATTIALEACGAAQREARLRGGDSAWCAWIDPAATLYAPAAAASGVCLERLLVVRPSFGDLARIAVRVASSRIFSVVVVDVSALPGASASAVSLDKWANVVRRLALGVEGGDTAVLLLSDTNVARPLSLPVAMRLELSRPKPDVLSVRVAKERFGRVSAPLGVAWTRPGFGELHRAVR